ncbi:hypothetical protein, partial [Sinorhizobium medicae]|uniref:hypothetical protein n=1 Tax=Sinorhizobium medicae TaxID=110321 RepID=UPI001AECD426
SCTAADPKRRRKKLTRGKFDRFFCIATFYCAAHFWGRAVLMAVIKVDLKMCPIAKLERQHSRPSAKCPTKLGVGPADGTARPHFGSKGGTYRRLHPFDSCGMERMPKDGGKNSDVCSISTMQRFQVEEKSGG